MTRLQEFIAADAPSLALQEKFLHAEHRSSQDSMYGLRYPVYQDGLAARETGVVQRLPESIWLLAHKIVAFTQSYVQQSKWDDGVLNWMFVSEPWWAIEYKDFVGYANLFSKQEWFSAMQVLSRSHRYMVKETENQKFASEKQAVLYFLKDSQQFAEQMYRRL